MSNLQERELSAGIDTNRLATRLRSMVRQIPINYSGGEDNVTGLHDDRARLCSPTPQRFTTGNRGCSTRAPGAILSIIQGIQVTFPTAAGGRVMSSPMKRTQKTTRPCVSLAAPKDRSWTETEALQEMAASNLIQEISGAPGESRTLDTLLRRRRETARSRVFAVASGRHYSSQTFRLCSKS